MSKLEDTMMSVGDIMSTLGMFSTLGFPYKFDCFPNDLPHIYHDIPPGVLMISPSVLMISPTVLMISSTVLMISPGVLNTPGVLHRHYAG